LLTVHDHSHILDKSIDALLICLVTNARVESNSTIILITISDMAAVGEILV